MAQETLVILINLIIHQSLLTHQLAVYAPLETVYYLLKDKSNARETWCVILVSES